MRQVSYSILSLAFLIFTQSWLLNAAVTVTNVVSHTSDVEAISAAVDAAAKKAEALRARLQSHVEAQVNKILSEKNAQGAGGGGGGGTQKLELKIDLPPDLAALVNTEGGAALKIHQFGRKEVSDLEEVTVTLDSTPPKVVESDKGATSSDTLCPLGTYSDNGFATGNSDCEPCPEGQTTTRLGSDACVVVTEEDLLGMFYDLVNGDKWSERQRRGWKSDLSACEWEGVSCDDNGEINGMAFPIIGLNTETDVNNWQ